MFKQFFLVLLVSIFSTVSVSARETIFSCKEEYDSDYNEHILTSTTLDHDTNAYRLIIVDHYQLVEFFSNLYITQNVSVHSLEVLFSRCTFSKDYEWEVKCNRPLSATFYDQKGNPIASLTNMDISYGHFNTEEENKNWFFSSLGLSVSNKFAEIKAQFHPNENCKK